MGVGRIALVPSGHAPRRTPGTTARPMRRWYGWSLAICLLTATAGLVGTAAAQSGQPTFSSAPGEGT